MRKHWSDQESGWADEILLAGTRYHFEHVSREEAEALIAGQAGLYVLVTINTSIADDGSMHRDLYFAEGIDDALAKAVTFHLNAQFLPQYLIEMRPATEVETLDWLEATGVDGVRSLRGEIE